jgi:RNA polymerase sigma factor (TIGR02999 family)
MDETTGPYEPHQTEARELFAELKKIARARLNDAGAPTHLNTTALVNESYLRLAGRLPQLSFPSPGHFYAYASKVMRSIIVDMVRERLTERRGAGQGHITLDSAIAETVAADEPLQVDQALQALEQVEPRLARVVEMRYFGGMTDAEIADALGVTDRTVRRDWDKARAILRTMLS